MSSLARGVSACAVPVVSLCAACSQPEYAPVLGAATGPVIYGTDDRVEFGVLTGVPWSAQAAVRAVALIPATRVRSPGETMSEAGAIMDDASIMAQHTSAITDDAGTNTDDAGTNTDDAGVTSDAEVDAAGAPAAQTAATRFQLCPEERFGEQPSSADCSGVLVAGDLVLTAGHCFEADDGCERYIYALDYLTSPANQEFLRPTLVQCRELVLREVGRLADGSDIDYALVRLAHTVGAIEANLLSDDSTIKEGDTVTSFGFPQGVPLKIEPRGKVLGVDRTGLDLRIDAYEGSSGSAIYDTAGRLVGILTGGEPDLAWDTTRKCHVSRTIAEDAGIQELERGMLAAVALSRACFRIPDLSFCASLIDGGMVAAVAASAESSAGAESFEPGATGPVQAAAEGSGLEEHETSEGPLILPDSPETAVSDERRQLLKDRERAARRLWFAHVAGGNARAPEDGAIPEHQSTSCSVGAGTRTPRLSLLRSFLSLLTLSYLHRRMRPPRWQSLRAREG